MAATIISINEWIHKTQNSPLILDVRSDAEYLHAHIPSAKSFPIFNDEERKIVGTTYKQISREAAIKIGLDFFGVKMKTLVEAAETLAGSYKTVFVHCWRGGMRSAAVAWLLDLYGFKVYVLKGGYKAYRAYVLSIFQQQFSIKIIGGKTGSGKTLLIKDLQNRKINAVDLEGLAHHKGSSFGGLGELAQPTQEQFENNLADELLKIISENGTIYLEDESQRIGHVNIPNPLWAQMRQAMVCFIDIPFEERLNWIVQQYGEFEIEKLKAATTRIQKRLGGLIYKQIIEQLDNNSIKAAFRLLLEYYDREYDRAYQRRENLKLTKFSFEKMNIEQINNAICASIL